MILLFLYASCVPLANFMIENVGSCRDNICTIPVFPGVSAPSGVIMIGAALVLRDMIQRRYGPLRGYLCILVGAAMSSLFASPSLAVAATLSFLLAETADFAVYTPLARRRFLLAVLLSGIAGSVVDTVIFLYVAFGSLDYFVGQTIGKVYATVFFVLLRIRQAYP